MHANKTEKTFKEHQIHEVHKITKKPEHFTHAHISLEINCDLPPKRCVHSIFIPLPRRYPTAQIALDPPKTRKSIPAKSSPENVQVAGPSVGAASICLVIRARLCCPPFLHLLMDRSRAGPQRILYHERCVPGTGTTRRLFSANGSVVIRDTREKNGGVAFEGSFCTSRARCVIWVVLGVEVVSNFARFISLLEFDIFEKISNAASLRAFRRALKVRFRLSRPSRLNLIYYTKCGIRKLVGFRVKK